MSEFFTIRNQCGDEPLTLTFPAVGAARGVSRSMLTIVPCTPGPRVLAPEEAANPHADAALDGTVWVIPPRSFAVLELTVTGRMHLDLALRCTGASAGLDVSMTRTGRSAVTQIACAPVTAVSDGDGGGESQAADDRNWTVAKHDRCGDGRSVGTAERGGGELTHFAAYAGRIDFGSMPLAVAMRMAVATSTSATGTGTGTAGTGSETAAANHHHHHHQDDDDHHPPAGTPKRFPLEWSVSCAMGGAKRQASALCVAHGPGALDAAGCDWMGSLWDVIADVSLPRIAVPGSHDSGAFHLTRRVSALAADSPLMRAAPLSVIHRWGVTQCVGITEQLHYGVRYFDMRITYDARSDDFLFVHTLLGGSIWAMLREIDIFSAAHPREIIYVDLNHFYLGRDEALEARFVRELHAHPIMKRSAARMYIEHATPRLLADEARTPVIVLLPLRLAEDHAARLLAGKEPACETCDAVAAAAPGSAPTWPHDRIVSDSWPRAAAPSALIANNQAMVERFTEIPSSLFVLQGVLTPGPGVIAPSVLGRGPRALEDYTVDAMAATAAGLAGVWCGAGSRVGVVLLDFVTRSAALEMCIASNRTRHGQA
jgi:hypothetical protein